jgi:uncharacterized protein
MKGAPDHGLPPAVVWAGPGLTAFAGPAGPDRIGQAATIDAPDRLSAAFGRDAGSDVIVAVEAYLGEGGGPCVVLNLPHPDSLPPERRAAAWVGEDGGPGRWTGVLGLLDREDVGTIAVPGLRDPDLRRRLISSLDGRTDRFLVLEEVQGEGIPTSGSSAAGASSFPGTDRTALASGGSEGCGRLLAVLERSDFREARPEGAIRTLCGEGHPTLGARSSVEDWRLREGLRRSIDLGTRWVVFEPDGDLLRRRVEREVSAFLDRLRRLGLLEGGTPDEAFRVRCGSRPAGRGEGLLAIDIDVKWKRCIPPSVRGRARSCSP